MLRMSTVIGLMSLALLAVGIISTGTYMRAPHLGRTRYMTCSECGKKSWQKKTLIKDE